MSENQPNAWSNGLQPGLLGAGLMIYEMDIIESDKELFEAWYSHEHMRERVGTPGFRRGRRYLRTDGRLGRRHLTIYETDDTTVFTSDAYLERLENPTSLTRQLVPRFIDGNRTVLKAIYSHGGASGAQLSLVRAPFGRNTDWQASFAHLLREDSSLLGMHAAVPDIDATMAKSSTVEGSDAEEGPIDNDIVVLIEGTGNTDSAAQKFLHSHDMNSGTISTYSFVMSL